MAGGIERLSLSMNLKVGRVSPLRAAIANRRVRMVSNGAHGVTRPTTTPGSWSQCAPMFWDWRLSINRSQRIVRKAALKTRISKHWRAGQSLPVGREASGVRPIHRRFRTAGDQRSDAGFSSQDRTSSAVAGWGQTKSRPLRKSLVRDGGSGVGSPPLSTPSSPME
jgi:hypothetical protein